MRRLVMTGITHRRPAVPALPGLNARRRRRVALRRWALGDTERDLGYCPHYRGVGICFQMGVCANPNVMEPQCETCEPVDGWPSTYYISLGELDYQPAAIGRRITV
jgi:hypothetical protein